MLYVHWAKVTVDVQCRTTGITDTAIYKIVNWRISVWGFPLDFFLLEVTTRLFSFDDFQTIRKEFSSDGHCSRKMNGIQGEMQQGSRFFHFFRIKSFLKGERRVAGFCETVPFLRIFSLSWSGSCKNFNLLVLRSPSFLRMETILIRALKNLLFVYFFFILLKIKIFHLIWGNKCRISPKSSP